MEHEARPARAGGMPGGPGAAWDSGDRGACRGCGAVLPAGARFCDHCGARQPDAAGPGAGAPPGRVPPVATLHGGRYRVVRWLGAGSQRDVYLGYDAQADRRIAIGLSPVGDLDDVALSRLAREVEVLQHLGSHPNIVALTAFGREAGWLYSVHELAAAGDLATRIARAPAGLPVADVLRIGADVCRALAHAHARGIVHRDVKPSNILFDADGRARLADFGISFWLKRSRLSRGGAVTGAVAYMAPEHALALDDQAPAPRIDLYSLGVVLYELCTGRLPFDAPQLPRLLHLVVSQIPPRVLARRDVPPALDALVMALIDKKPGRRPPDAPTVLARLDAIAGGRTAAAAPAPAGVDELPFVGREAAFRRARAALDAAVGGAAGVVLFTGAPGVGATRALRELEDYARLRGCTVAAVAGGSGDARVLADAILHAAECAPATGAPLAAVVAGLRAACRARPALVAVHDLHAASPDQQQLVIGLAAELRQEPVVLACTAADGGSAAALAALRRAPHCTTLPLGPLTADDAAALVRAVAPDLTAGAQRRWGADLCEQTGGMPRLLAAVLPALAATDAFDASDRPDADRRARIAAVVDASADVRAFVDRMLAGLASGTRALLARAARVGECWRLDDLRADGADAAHVRAGLEDAERAGVLVREPDDGAYRFHPPLLAIVLGSGAPAPAAVRDANTTGAADRLARATNAAEARRAVDYALHAGPIAVQGHAYDVAIELYQRALTTLQTYELDEGPLELRLLAALGDVQRKAGLGAADVTFAAAAQVALALNDRDAAARMVLQCGAAGAHRSVLIEEASSQAIGLVLARYQDNAEVRDRLTDVLSRNILAGSE